MRILVTGATGLLGTEVVGEARARGREVIGLARADLDVTDATQVMRSFDRHRPHAVVHCAAYTAVDRAEAEPDRARAVNVDGTAHVAQAAAKLGADLLCVSTDYVFDGLGRAPYLPTDEPAPLSVYGRTKLAGEWAALDRMPEAIVVRTSWLYGGEQGFVPATLRRAERGEPLRVVDDQRGRPTWAPHAASAMLDLLERRVRGIWHVAGGGECTWLDLAREAVRLRGLDVRVDSTTSAEFGAPARRPAYSVLDLTATEAALGRPMPHWKEGLEAYLRHRAPPSKEKRA